MNCTRGNDTPEECVRCGGEGGDVALAVLLNLAGLGATNATALFDVRGHDSVGVCLYELVKVCGSCRDPSTQFALVMKIGVDQEIGKDASAGGKVFEIPVSGKTRQLRKPSRSPAVLAAATEKVVPS